MAKIRIQRRPKGKKRDETAAKIADIMGVSPSYVRLVINGDRKNEKIMEAVITYRKGKNELLRAIEELVPFENN